MTTYTHHTAPTQFVEASGIRFAYRRFGKPGSVPLIFNMHFMGTMDYWDPVVTDGFAKDREVILFDNAGVSSSSGRVPDTIAGMGANAIAFIRALDLNKVDVLGFSIGGLVAQEITLQAPDLVRRLILVGTGPRSGESMDTGTPEGRDIFGATYQNPDDLWLRVQFTPSEASQAKGREFIQRFRLRRENRDPEMTQEAALAQRAAIGDWGVKRDGAWDYLKAIKQPTLVVNGSSDVIHLHHQLLHPATAPAGRAAHYLPGFRARLVVPVSRAVRPPRLDVPRPEVMGVRLSFTFARQGERS